MDSDVNQSVLDSVLSLNDDLRTQNKTISRLANVTCIIKIKYFCEFVILVMFRKLNCDKKKIHVEDLDSNSNSDAEDLDSDLNAEDLVLILDSCCSGLSLGLVHVMCGLNYNTA